MVSVSLLMIVFTYLYSNDMRGKENVRNSTEAYHAEFNNLSNWQIKKISNQKSVKDVSRILLGKDIQVSDTKLSDLQIVTKMVWMEKAGELCNFYLGRAPEKENEIVVDKWIMEVLGLPLEVGQTVTLSVLLPDKESKEQNLENVEFQVVGIRRDVTSQRLKNLSYILCSNDFLQNYSQKMEQNLRIVLRNNFDCIKQLKNIGTAVGMAEEQMDMNVEYLDEYNINLDSVLQYLIIVMVIILVASMVIQNIFSMYMIQKVKIYGTLKAIGFTKRQQRKFILQEGILLAATGSLLGIVAGGSLSIFLINLLGERESVDAGRVVIFSPMIILMCFLLGIVIVLVGIVKPMKTVLKMSETQAMRFTSLSEDMNSYYNTKCDTKITIQNVIIKNLSRHRKKTLYHMSSIILTGSLFLIIASVIESMDVHSLIQNSIHGDFSIQLIESVSRNKESKIGISKDVISTIECMDGVNSVNTIMYERFRWKSSDAERYIELSEEYTEFGIEYKDIDSIFYGYDDLCIEEILEMTDMNSVNLEMMKNNNVAIAVQDSNSSLKVHDKVRFIVSDQEVEFEIVAIVPQNITYRGYKASANDFIIHQNLFEKLDFDNRIQRIFVNVNGDQIKAIKQKLLDEIVQKDENLALVSYEELNAEYNDSKNIISVSAYSVVILLFLIAIFNLVNSTLANILSRKHEIGIMQAIGLSNRQLNWMLQMENITVVGVSCTIAILLGMPIGYIAFKIFQQRASYARYTISVGAIGILFVSFLLVQVVVTYLAKREISKESTIEKIRHIEI